jgi:hypothetical protein
MNDPRLPLNQTQRVRFEAALREFQMLTPTTVLTAAVTITDTIAVNHDDMILRLPTLFHPISLFVSPFILTGECMQGTFDIGSEWEGGGDSLWGDRVGQQASLCADAPGKVLTAVLCVFTGVFIMLL